MTKTERNKPQGTKRWKLEDAGGMSYEDYSAYLAGSLEVTDLSRYISRSEARLRFDADSEKIENILNTPIYTVKKGAKAEWNNRGE